MNKNLKTAIILLASLGFMLGIIIGRVQDVYLQSPHHPTTSHLTFDSPAMDNVLAWQIQQRIEKRVEEKLRKAKELEIKAMDKALKAEKREFRFRCQ